ncbi:MAG: diguanylate cyclase [Ramlibacter sp.]|nr:diguanylate cyclase [Ramlibacter sp.]
MPCVVRRAWAAGGGLGVLLLLAVLWAGAALAELRPAPGVLVLADGQHRVDAQGLGAAWVDPGGATRLEQVLAGAAAFQPARADRIYSLGADGALWLRLRLSRDADAQQRWLLAFPMPAIDRVTVYQQDSKGKWQGRSAGDTMAVADWPERGRYPHFRLDLPAGQARDVYVRIRHLTFADFPVQLLTEAAYDQRIQLEYLGLGLTFGALLLLVATCLAHSVVYRDGAYAWYASYTLVTALAVASYTGAAAHLLWPDFDALADSPQACLAMLGSAASLLFVRSITGISARHPVVDQLVFAGGLAGIALAAAFLAMDKSTGLIVLAAYAAGTSLISVWIASAGWRRGDVVGAWVLAASAPLAFTVALAGARLFGWLPVSFGTQYAVVVALALQAPLLLVALNIRSRERHGAEIRELALSTHDALTGLLAPHLFHDRLRQVVARYRRDRDNAAVVFIDLVNHPHIKARYGTAVAEQSLLRCVIKLRRLLRDVDTVARIDEARFAVILEGMGSRIAVTDRAARLIAAGLMPLQGLKPEVTLQFHIAAVLLEDRAPEAPELVRSLSELLATMSPRTRRPIRFLEPEATMPATIDSDSSLLESDSLPPSAQAPAAVPLRTASRP